MKVYLLNQSVNDRCDTYDSCIVVAESKIKAKYLHPAKYIKNWDGIDESCGKWCDVEHVVVKHIGEAVKGSKKGVVLASYNWY